MFVYSITMVLRGRIVKRRRTLRKRRMNISRRKTYMSRRAVAKLAVNRTRYDASRSWAFSTASTNGFWRYQSFTAADIQDFAAMASVFDEYKVNAIKTTWRPRYDSVNAPTAAGAVAQPQAYAHIVVDPASITPPTGTYDAANLNAFLEQGKLRTVTLNRPFSVYFKPKQDMSLLGSSSGTRVSTKWLKTTDTSVPMYGYHMFLQQNNFNATNTNIQLDCFVTVYAQFRNLK